MLYLINSLLNHIKLSQLNFTFKFIVVLLAQGFLILCLGLLFNHCHAVIIVIVLSTKADQ